ncbi:hypothetical protein ABXT08_05535 [Chryseobacterium sp. NRRL B-14859]|uniref:hypothetical protein n=1 Tax=Chryseobacterium sp. NRRL B-14859 TaxID=1562763 RepID=UPI00339A6037
MKKLNVLMLLVSVFLMLNCMEELSNEEKLDETPVFHGQKNKVTFSEFLKITKNNEDDLFNSKSGKNSSLNGFDIDTSYILKSTEEATVTKFSFFLKKKDETNKSIVYNMFYYRTKLGEWKYFIVKIEHTRNPNKLYGWKKTSLYKLQNESALRRCNSSYQFGNIDWFQCSAGHGPDCSRNGGACCAGCHHSMAVSYWVNSCDESAPGEFDINYGGGAGNPITMEDIKAAIKNNISAETYQKFLSLSFNLQQGVISCFYNDYLANDLVSEIINFFYTHPNTQNPDVIYYRLLYLKELIQQNPDISVYDFAELFSLDEISNTSLLNETIDDWKRPDRVKPTMRFKKNVLVNCVYNKAKTSVNFNQYLKNFDGRFSTAHLIFDLKPINPANNAETAPPLGYWITITINSNNLNRPYLDIARTFMHEIIHAEMFRILLSLAPTSNGQINTIELINMLNSHNYPGIYDYFRRFGLMNMQHEQMAAHYINIVKNFLKQIDSSLTNQQYEAIAWQGLQDTERWNQLTLTQRNEINITYSSWYNSASYNCQ